MTVQLPIWGVWWLSSSVRLEVKWSWVRDSTEALGCVLAQDTFPLFSTGLTQESKKSS